MSGLEVLGALAAAAQIASYTPTIIVAISQIYGALRNAPTKIQQGCQQLQQLVDTAKEIEQSSFLQTPSTNAHLNALIERILALQKMLTAIISGLEKQRFKRLLTACLRPRHEVRIAEALGQIEREKSALVLSILRINAQITYSTNESLEGLVKVLPTFRETGDDVKAIRRLSTTILRAVNRPHKRSVVTDNEMDFPSPREDDFVCVNSRDNQVSPIHTEQVRNLMSLCPFHYLCMLLFEEDSLIFDHSGATKSQNARTLPLKAPCSM